MEAEHASDVITRECFNRHVVVADHGVVVVSRALDGVFNLLKRLLKLHEVLVRLELWIGLDNSEQRPHGFLQSCLFLNRTFVQNIEIY